MDASEENEFTIDPATLGGGDYKAGDVFTVIGHTSDGMLKVKCEHSKEDMGWEKDFDKSMAPEPEPQQATDGGGAEEVT
jgi:hypothetical protein